MTQESRYSAPFRTFILLLMLALSGVATAAPDPVAVLQQALKTEQAGLEKLRSELESLKHDQARRLAVQASEPIRETDLAQARLALESARVDVQSVQLDIAGTLARIQKLQERITGLQHPSQPASDNPASNKEQDTELKQLQSLLDLNRQRLKLQQQRSDLLQQKVTLMQKWLASLQTILQQRQAAQRQESLVDLQQKLQREIQEKQAESSRLQQQLEAINPADSDARTRQQLLTWKIRSLNESIPLLDARLKLATEKAEAEGIDTTTANQIPPEKLQAEIEKLQELRQQVDPDLALTQGKLRVLHQQLQLLEKQHQMGEVSDPVYQAGKNGLLDLITGFQVQEQGLQQLQQEIEQKSETLEAAYKLNLSRSLTAHQPLPKTAATWRALAREAGRLPLALWTAIRTVGRQLAGGWQGATSRNRIYLILMILVTLGVTLTLGRLPPPPRTPMADNQTFTTKAREILYALLRSVRPVVLLGGSLLAAGWQLGLDSRHFQLLLLLVLIWLTLVVAGRLSYWLFVSPLVAPERRQPRLHHHVLWILGGAALLTLLVGMGHAGLLSEPMRALVNRLFMLLLLPLAYLGLHLRTLFLQRLRAGSERPFWTGLISLATQAIPLAILSAALVGLAGYINLAWFLAAQLALVLGVLMAWLVLRHLMLDAMERLRRVAESRPERAAFWKQGVIDPLQLLLDFALLLLSAWTLVRLLSWSTGSDVGGMVLGALNHPLFTVGKQSITSLHLLTASLIAFVVIYLGIWSRRLTYDLVFRKIRDRGLRNSLSVFTQYLIIVIGLLLALELLGIKLTSLAVFAGALGVGIGFGLQNIANNFISGLILLAERPVRTDDWVTISGKEGKIRSIGMRSLILTTWDNQDVIIPNAELITNPVVNWTLSDTLIRTVFEVGVRYQDDPHQAQKVILDAVSMHPEVSLERPPQVLLTEFADSSVNFRVQFFTDAERQPSRLRVKSEVMFAIWDALEEAGIGIPFPQQDIYIKELPGKRE